MESSKKIGPDEFNQSRRLFLPKDALKDFGPKFLDEVQCRMWFAERFHSDGVKCPRCKVPIKTSRLSTFWQGKTIKCQSCKKKLKIFTGTFFSGTHLNFQEMYLLMALLGLGLDNRTIGEIINKNQETVRLYRDKFSGMERILKAEKDRYES